MFLILGVAVVLLFILATGFAEALTDARTPRERRRTPP
jgi:hypothetical protein